MIVTDCVGLRSRLCQLQHLLQAGVCSLWRASYCGTGLQSSQVHRDAQVLAKRSLQWLRAENKAMTRPTALAYGKILVACGKSRDKLIERANVAHCSGGFAEAVLLRWRCAVMKEAARARRR